MNKAEQIVAELQSLDPQQPGTWPRYLHICIALVLAIGVGVLGFQNFILPLQEELKTVQAEEETLRGDFERKQRKVATLDALKEQLAEMERSFGAMLRQLPSKAEIANLLIDISQTRLAASLEEELFQPSGEVPKEFYAEVPNRIIVTGDYHEMGAFVSGVATLPRIVTIEDVQITPVSAGSSNLRLSAVAKTYRYLDEGEVAESSSARRGRR